MDTRRNFIRIAALCGTAALSTRYAFAADAPVLDEKDPQAMALGYVSDASRANKAKYPNYAAGQACANCQFFQAKTAVPMAPCPLFGGKQVAAKGWCSAYAKKTA